MTISLPKRTDEPNCQDSDFSSVRFRSLDYYLAPTGNRRTGASDGFHHVHVRQSIFVWVFVLWNPCRRFQMYVSPSAHHTTRSIAHRKDGTRRVLCRDTLAAPPWQWRRPGLSFLVWQTTRRQSATLVPMSVNGGRHAPRVHLVCCAHDSVPPSSSRWAVSLRTTPRGPPPCPAPPLGIDQGGNNRVLSARGCRLLKVFHLALPQLHNNRELHQLA